MKTLLAVILLGLLAGGALWERKESAQLRVENEALRAEKQEAERLAAENSDLPKLRAAATAAATTGRSGNAELLRLRNQVRQLREQKQEAEKLRAANQRATEEIKSGKFTPRRLADVEGAVPREKWTFAGFATPEATVQSFFAGAATGEMDQFINCLTAEGAAKVRAELAKNPEGEREAFKKSVFAKLGSISAFRVAAQKSQSPDQQWLYIEVTAEGERMPMPLRRVGNEWKIDVEAREPQE